MSTGDIDRADALLEHIKPQCEQLMRGYGIIWDPTLDQFLHCVLLGYSPFVEESFLAFFLRNARYNFDIPDRPINVNPLDFHGTGLSSFRRTWTSQPERVVDRIEKQIRKKSQQ